MDDLESNLVEFFGQWKAFNAIPIGGEADSDDGADDEQVDEGRSCEIRAEAEGRMRQPDHSRH